MSIADRWQTACCLVSPCIEVLYTELWVGLPELGVQEVKYIEINFLNSFFPPADFAVKYSLSEYFFATVSRKPSIKCQARVTFASQRTNVKQKSQAKLLPISLTAQLAVLWKWFTELTIQAASVENQIFVPNFLLKWQNYAVEKNEHILIALIEIPQWHQK